jgi:hypothetical protein
MDQEESKRSLLYLQKSSKFITLLVPWLLLLERLAEHYLDGGNPDLAQDTNNRSVEESKKSSFLMSEMIRLETVLARQLMLTKIAATVAVGIITIAIGVVIALNI